MQRSTLRTVASVQFPSTFYEQVTFLSRNSGSNQSTFTSYTLARVRRKNINDKEQAKRGLVGISSLSFVVGQDQLDNAQAGPGGTVAVTGGPSLYCTAGNTSAPYPKPRDIFLDANSIAYVIPDKGIERPLLANAHDCAVQANPANPSS